MFGLLGKVATKLAPLGRGVSKVGKIALGPLALVSKAWDGVKDYVETPLRLFEGYCDYKFRSNSLKNDEIIRLGNDKIYDQQLLQYEATNIDNKDPQLQELKHELDRSVNRIESLEQAELSKVKAPELDRPILNLTGNPDFQFATNSIDKLYTLHHELEDLHKRESEAHYKILFSKGITGIVSGLYDLSAMSRRLIALETETNAVANSILTNQFRIANVEDTITQIRNRAAEEKLSVAETYHSIHEEKEELDHRRTKYDYYKLKEKLKFDGESLERASKPEKFDTDRYITELEMFMTVGTAILTQLLDRVGFSKQESEEDDTSNFDLTSASGIIDAMTEMFGGIDFSKQSDQGFLKNLITGFTNIPKIIKNNVQSAYSAGHDFAGPIGGGLLGGLTLLGTPLTLTLGMGASLAKLTKDLITGISVLPGMGKIAETLGLADSGKVKKAHEEISNRKIILANASAGYSKGEIKDSQLLEAAESLIKKCEEYKDVEESQDAIDWAANVLKRHGLERKKLASQKEYFGIISGKTSIPSPLKDVPEVKGDTFSDSQNILNESEPTDQQGLDLLSIRDVTKVPDAKGGYHAEEWDPRLRIKADVPGSPPNHFDGLRMGGLKSEWVYEAYEDAGLKDLALVTSGHRTAEEQRKVNPKGGSSKQHEAGRAIDLRVGIPNQTSTKDQIKNGVAVMRNLFDRIEVEGLNRKDYQGLIHSVKGGAPHVHLVYTGDGDLSGDMNIGPRTAEQDRYRKEMQKSFSKDRSTAGAIWVSANDEKGNSLVKGDFSQNTGDKTYDPEASEIGDPAQSANVTPDNSDNLSRTEFEQSQLIVLTRLNNLENNILSVIGINAIQDQPDTNLADYVTAPRRSI